MLTQEDHKFFMDSIITHAEIAGDKGLLPIGACLVNNKDKQWHSLKSSEKLLNPEQNGNKFNKDYDGNIKPCNPIAHAEINCIIETCEKIGSTNLKDFTLFTTLEPCLLCISALVISRIDTIVYAVPDRFAGYYSLGYDIIDDNYLNRKNIKVIHNFMEDKAKFLYKDYFKMIEKADGIDLHDEEFNNRNLYQQKKLYKHYGEDILVLKEGRKFGEHDKHITKDFILKEYENYKKLVDDKQAFGITITPGELENYDFPIIELRKVSHLITESWLDISDFFELEWHMQIEFLDSERGKLLKEHFKNCKQSVSLIAEEVNDKNEIVKGQFLSLNFIDYTIEKV